MASEIIISENASSPSVPSSGKGKIYSKTDGVLYYQDDTGAESSLSNMNHTMGITVDGGISTPTTGSKGFVTIPFSGTLTHWYLAADASGSAVIDIKRSGSSIVGAGNKPTLSSAQSGNAAIASWTSVAISAGDIIEFNLDSITTIKRINLVIKITT